MRTLSTGQPSTLGSYRQLMSNFYGEDSPAVKYLDEKIRESAGGADEEVIPDESQMVYLLVSMHENGDAGAGDG